MNNTSQNYLTYEIMDRINKQMISDCRKHVSDVTESQGMFNKYATREELRMCFMKWERSFGKSLDFFMDDMKDKGMM